MENVTPPYTLTESTTTDYNITEYDNNTESVVDVTDIVTTEGYTSIWSTNGTTAGTNVPEEPFPIVVVASSAAAAGLVLVIIIIVIAVLYRRGRLNCNCCRQETPHHIYARRPSASMPTIAEADGYVRHEDSDGDEYYTREGKVYFRAEHPDGQIYYRDIPRSQTERKSAAYQYARFGDPDKNDSPDVGDGYNLATEVEEPYILMTEADQRPPASPPSYSQVQQSGATPGTSSTSTVQYQLATKPQSSHKQTTPINKSVSFAVSSTQETKFGDNIHKSSTLPSGMPGLSHSGKSNRHTYQNPDELREEIEALESQDMYEDYQTKDPLYVNQEDLMESTAADQSDLPDYMNKSQVQDILSTGNFEQDPADDIQLISNISPNQVQSSDNQDMYTNYAIDEADDHIYGNTQDDETELNNQHHNGSRRPSSIHPPDDDHIYGNTADDEIGINNQHSIRSRRPTSVLPPEDKPPVKTYTNYKPEQRDYIPAADHSDVEEDIY